MTEELNGLEVIQYTTKKGETAFLISSQTQDISQLEVRWLESTVILEYQ